MIDLFLIFKDFPYWFPEWLYQFQLLSKENKVLHFSTTSLAFIASCFILSPTDVGEVNGQSYFDLYFSTC